METSCLLGLQMGSTGILGEVDLARKCVQQTDSGDEVGHMLLGSEEVVDGSSCMTSSIDFEFTSTDLESGTDFSMDHSSVFDITESVIGGVKVDSGDLFTTSTIFDENVTKQSFRVESVDNLNIGSCTGRRLNLYNDLGLKLQVIPLNNLQFVSTVETSEGLHILAVPATSSLGENASGTVAPFTNSLDNLTASDLSAIHGDFTKYIQQNFHNNDDGLSIKNFKTSNNNSTDDVIQVIGFKNTSDQMAPVMHFKNQTFDHNADICADGTYKSQSNTVSVNPVTDGISKNLSDYQSSTMTELAKSMPFELANTFSKNPISVSVRSDLKESCKGLKESKIVIDLRKLVPNRKRRLVSLLNSAQMSKLHLLHNAKDTGNDNILDDVSLPLHTTPVQDGNQRSSPHPKDMSSYNFSDGAQSFSENTNVISSEEEVQSISESACSISERVHSISEDLSSISESVCSISKDAQSISESEQSISESEQCVLKDIENKHAKLSTERNLVLNLTDPVAPVWKDVSRVMEKQELKFKENLDENVSRKQLDETDCSKQLKNDINIDSNETVKLMNQTNVSQIRNEEFIPCIAYENSTMKTQDRCFKCEICLAKFIKEGNYKKHILIHGTSSRNGYGLRENHLKQIRQQLLEDMTPDISEDSISEHIGTQKDGYEVATETGLKCEMCSLSFTKEGNLTRHRLTHTISQVAVRFQCDVCDKNFLQRCDLKRHQLIHTRQYPYSCPICHKGFIRNSDLVVHERFHSKEKHFKCHLCTKTYYQSGDLNRHIRRSHERSCQFTCRHCNKKYMTRKCLQQHESNKHLKT